MKINKSWTRRLTRILTLLLLISSVPSYGAAPRFKDVQAGYWAYSYIEDMGKLGYLNGYPDGTFKPGNSLTFMETMSTLSNFTNPTAAERTNASVAYGSLLDELNIKQEWERNAVSLALYKDIVSENELRNANSMGLLNKPSQKITASVFLVRAMGLENLVNSNNVVALSYKDAESMSSTERRHVRVLLDAKILSTEGEGDGNFGPKSALRREVMATMLSKAYDYLEANPTIPTTPTPEIPGSMETETVKGSIVRITDDGGRKFLVMDDRFGDEIAYVIESSTSITMDGRSTSVSALNSGQEVELTVQKNSRNLISIKSTSVEEDIEGIIKSISSSNNKITLEYKEGTKNLTKDYNVDKNAKIYLNDKSAKLSDLKLGDMAEVRVKDNTILDIEAKSKSQKVEGVVKEISPVKDSRDKDYHITIVDEDDNSYEFLINSDTYIYRNNKSAKVGDLKLKDLAYIVSEYGVAKDVDARVVRKEIEGYVLGITTRFNKNTLVTVKNKETNKEEDYELTKDVYIKVDNKIASSLPANPGYYVEIVTEGDEIIEIFAESASMETSINGKIRYVDYKNRIIEVEVDNVNLGSDNYGREISIYIDKDADVTHRGSTKSYSFDDLRRGDRIIAVGKYEGVNFVADTIQVR